MSKAVVTPSIVVVSVSRLVMVSNDVTVSAGVSEASHEQGKIRKCAKNHDDTETYQ
jgi:hypothetical protein